MGIWRVPPPVVLMEEPGGRPSVAGPDPVDEKSKSDAIYPRTGWESNYRSVNLGENGSGTGLAEMKWP